MDLINYLSKQPHGMWTNYEATPQNLNLIKTSYVTIHTGLKIDFVTRQKHPNSVDIRPMDIYSFFNKKKKRFPLAFKIIHGYDFCSI
jgi:hypothetical protein